MLTTDFTCEKMYEINAIHQIINIILLQNKSEQQTFKCAHINKHYDLYLKYQNDS